MDLDHEDHGILEQQSCNNSRVQIPTSFMKKLEKFIKKMT